MQHKLIPNGVKQPFHAAFVAFCNLRKIDGILHKTQLSAIYALLSQAYTRVKQQQSTIQSLKISFLYNLSTDMMQIAVQYSKAAYQRTARKSKENFTKKYAELYTQKFGLAPGVIWPDKDFRDSVVSNCSSASFTEQQLDILALGPKFVLPPKETPVLEVITAVEKGLQRTDASKLSQTKDNIRATSANILCRSTIASDQPPLPDHCASTIKELCKKAVDENLVYLNADKGSKTVVLDKQEYNEKMGQHFSNVNLFEKSSASKYSALYCSLKSVLSQFLTLSCIMSLLPSADRAPLPSPYPLVKLHKPNRPFRLITPTYSAIAYQVSKHLDCLLKPAVRTLQFRIGSISNFVTELRQFDLKPTYFVASIDVTALFDNVCISSFMAQLPSILVETETHWRSMSTCFAKASITQIVSCFDLVLNNSFLKFNGRILRQKFGVAMGNPLSVSVSDIFLGLLEQEFLRNCPSAFKPLLYRRYIDDVFLIFDGPTTLLQDFLDYVHECLASTRIRFTSELENCKKLPFLDIVLHRTPSKFELSVYRKVTHSNRYISVFSFVPIQFMIATLKTLRSRALCYCVDSAALKSEFEFLRGIFLKQGYSAGLVNKFFSIRGLPAGCLPFRLSLPSIILPYFGTKTRQLANYLSSIGFQTTFTSLTTLNSILYKPTTRSPNAEKRDKNNVVYLLSCNQCNVMYVGETTRSFCVRFKEHIRDVSGSKSNVSAMSLHARDSAHTFELNRFLACSKDYFGLKFKESFFINANSDILCNSRSTDKCCFMPAVYSSLFHKGRIL